MKSGHTITPSDLATFKAYLLGRSASDGTARAYVKDIRHVYKVSGGEVTLDALMGYFARNVSPARKFRVAKAWNSWVKFNLLRSIDVPAHTYSPRHVPQKIEDSLEPEEYERAVEVAIDMGSRGRAALLLALTGARRSSVPKLKVGDVIKRRGQRFIKLQSKGSDEHLVPIDGRLAQLVDPLVEGRAATDSLIPGRVKGRPPAISTVYRTVREIGRRAKIEGNLHPHRLRHGFADWLRRQGVDIRVIQNMLGHQNITTTQRYFKVSSTDYEKVGELMRAAATKGKDKDEEDDDG